MRDIRWVDENDSPSVVGSRALHSLDHFDISATRRFTVTQYGASPHPETEKSPAYRTLLLMNALHTLALTDCLNLDFAFALDPNRTPYKAVVSPELEELVLYVKTEARLCVDELLEMVKERDSRGAKLSTITIVCPRESVPAKGVNKLMDHVALVEYRLEDIVPE